MPSRVDVAIVGYGPVAALSAILLSRAGIRATILERSTVPVVLPRAVGLDGESMRTFQRIGYAEEVSAILQPGRRKEELLFTDSKHKPHFAVEIPQFGENGWRDMAFFDQPELEALLREFIQRDDLADIRMGHKVTSLTQDAEGVTLESRQLDTGEVSTLRAAYVLGCDGASSFVRREVGINWTSLGYDQDWLVLDVTMAPEADLPLMTMQVCDPDRLVSYICVKDPNRRWELQLKEGESRDEMLRPERIEEFLRPWLPPEHYTLRRSAVYQFHAATADQWRVGRVLLAGDAAHQTPPFLGQGLNAGFRDAVNLGWKLPLVLSGLCGQELLDSYADERDAHARDLVEKAVGIGKLMENLAAGEAGSPAPHVLAPQRSGHRMETVLPPLRGGVLAAEQLAAGGMVGQLIRQPRVRYPDGRLCLLDDLFGDGFAVVARSAGDLEMGPEARRIFERLGGNSVCLEDVEVVEGVLDFAIERNAAVVLRPDRHVFGVVSEDLSLDRLLIELGERLALASG
jgi:3-(3-hydroxy-phenyl)propionate hydroxylase